MTSLPVWHDTSRVRPRVRLVEALAVFLLKYRWPVPLELPTPPLVEFRNFNLCPHCELLHEDPLLLRMNEGMPMISRSDGKNFHLVLADRPLPYPAECASGQSEEKSLCFWYSYRNSGSANRSTVVLVPSKAKGAAGYREIEFIADLLAAKLLRKPEVAVFYRLCGSFLQELRY